MLKRKFRTTRDTPTIANITPGWETLSYADCVVTEDLMKFKERSTRM